ncbi:MAG TPA: FAD:protein FMN transferase, partial [Sphingobacteriaceae bacterium]
SLLISVNDGISNYQPTSDVSLFNKSADGGTNSSIHFRTALEKSLAVACESGGSFDPTVMPLVNIWGFGPEKSGAPSTFKIDSIKKFVGYTHVKIEGKRISKDDPNVQVDFGGIGQGYGVDVISDFLLSQGVRNFLVELGGEGFASGRNLQRGEKWKVGIVNPLMPKDEQELMGYAVLEDEAFTTSGNYFNYRVIDGKKYGHTISPVTGFPVDHELISVSLFAPDCSTADAWDTAFFVGGKSKSLDFLKQHKSLGAVLVYLDNGTPRVFVSDNIKHKIFVNPHHDH